MIKNNAQIDPVTKPQQPPAHSPASSNNDGSANTQQQVSSVASTLFSDRANSRRLADKDYNKAAGEFFKSQKDFQENEGWISYLLR